jgi:hypothetical protein
MYHNLICHITDISKSDVEDEECVSTLIIIAPYNIYRLIEIIFSFIETSLPLLTCITPYLNQYLYHLLSRTPKET